MTEAIDALREIVGDDAVLNAVPLPTGAILVIQFQRRLSMDQVKLIAEHAGEILNRPDVRVMVLEEGATVRVLETDSRYGIWTDGWLVDGEGRVIVFANLVDARAQLGEWVRNGGRDAVVMRIDPDGNPEDVEA